MLLRNVNLHWTLQWKKCQVPALIVPGACRKACLQPEAENSFVNASFCHYIGVKCSPRNQFLERSSPNGGCLSMLVFSLRMFWASLSLDIAARGQLVPNVQRDFFPACILYFHFRASFVFKRLKKDNNSHVAGHSLNLQFIFFHWALWERDVCA